MRVVAQASTVLSRFTSHFLVVQGTRTATVAVGVSVADGCLVGVQATPTS